MKRIKLFLRKWLSDYFYFRKFVRKTGLTFKEYCCFIFQANDGKTDLTTSVVLNKKYQRTNTFWHVQNVLEIFVDEVYLFESNTDFPFIIDCGSNYGLSIIYFKALYPNSTILAFEADSQIAAACQYNIDEHSLSNVTIINSAVWDKEGFINFRGDSMQGGKVVGEDEICSRGVKSVRLRDYLTKSVDFLKIDIEGAELTVLKDCADRLAFVNYLFVEYHSESSESQRLSELLAILERAGYRYYIKESYNSMKYPFKNCRRYIKGFDLQLNIFAFRK